MPKSSSASRSPIAFSRCIATSALSTLPSSVLSVISSSSRGGIEFGLGQDALDAVDEIGPAELQRRDVHRHGDAGPGLAVGAGAAQHPFAEFDDQAGMLGDRDELRGLDVAALGMGPARQRLDAENGVAGGVDDRLIGKRASRPWRSLRAGRFRATCAPTGRRPSPRRRCRRDCGPRSWRDRAPCRHSASRRRRRVELFGR